MIKFLSNLSRYEAAEFSPVEVDAVRHDFHGEWHYTISPKSKALQQQFADGAYNADPAH